MVFRAVSSFLPWLQDVQKSLILYWGKNIKTSSSSLKIKNNWDTSPADCDCEHIHVSVIFHPRESRELFWHDNVWKKGIVLLLKVNSQECPASGPCGQTVPGWTEWDAECPTYCGCYMSDLLGSSDTSLGKRLLQDLKPSNYVRFTHLLWSWSLPSMFIYWLVCPVGLCRMNSHRKEAVGLVQIFYSSPFSKRARSCACPCSAVWERIEDVLRRSELCWVKFSVCLFVFELERGRKGSLCCWRRNRDGI